MPGMKLPYFESEAAEAQWWYDHREEIAEQLVVAIRTGQAGEGSVARRARKLREQEMEKNPAAKLPTEPVADELQHSPE